MATTCSLTIVSIQNRHQTVHRYLEQPTTVFTTLWHQPVTQEIHKQTTTSSKPRPNQIKVETLAEGQTYRQRNLFSKWKEMFAAAYWTSWRPLKIRLGQKNSTWRFNELHKEPEPEEEEEDGK